MDLLRRPMEAASLAASEIAEDKALLARKDEQLAAQAEELQIARELQSKLESELFEAKALSAANAAALANELEAACNHQSELENELNVVQQHVHEVEGQLAIATEEKAQLAAENEELRLALADAKKQPKVQLNDQMAFLRDLEYEAGEPVLAEAFLAGRVPIRVLKGAYFWHDEPVPLLHWTLLAERPELALSVVRNADYALALVFSESNVLALHIAAFYGYLDVCKELSLRDPTGARRPTRPGGRITRESGAVICCDGLTPIELARRECHQEVAQALEEARPPVEGGLCRFCGRDPESSALPTGQHLCAAKLRFSCACAHSWTTMLGWFDPRTQQAVGQQCIACLQWPTGEVLEFNPAPPAPTVPPAKAPRQAAAGKVSGPGPRKGQQRGRRR